MSAPPQEADAPVGWRRLAGTGARIAVSLLLVGALCAWLGLDQIGAVLRSAAPGPLARMSAWALLTLGMGAGNVLILVGALDPRVSRLAVAWAWGRAWALGMFSPGRLGELFFVRDAAGFGLGAGPGLAVLVLDKLLTFGVTVTVASAALAWLVFPRQALVLGLGGVLGLSAVAGVLAHDGVRAWARRRLLGRRETSFAGFSFSLRALLGSHRGAVALNVLLTCARQAVAALALQAGLEACGARIAWPLVLGLGSVAQISSLIPISFAGAGLVEATGVSFFTVVTGAPGAAVLGGYLVLRVMLYATGGVLLGVSGWRQTLPPTTPPGSR